MVGGSAAQAPTVLLLSTSDTDLITARASGAGYRWANPSRLVDGELAELLDGTDIAVVRILGGYRAWQDGIDALEASGVPTVVVSGEQTPDAELMGHSTTPAGVALQSHVYLAQGGVENLRQLHAFLCDTLLMTGFGFVAARDHPELGSPRDGPRRMPRARRSRCCTTAHSTWPATPATWRRCAGPIEDAGGRPLPVFCASLRTADAELLELLGTADALVTTVLAAGGSTPATVTAGGDDDTWNVAHLAALDIPILQGLCLTSSRSQWQHNDDGMSPLDVATQVAVPEFDGRIITVPFSFKEIDDEGLISYVADPERCARVAGLAVRHARLRAIAAPQKRVALVFSAYPTKHARIGNAVGLDTPASAVALLRAMREHGYAIDDIPGVDAGDGDALIHALIERGGQDADWLTDGQLEGNPIRLAAKDYRDWFATLPVELTDVVVKHWGPPPGELFVDRSQDPEGEIVIAALQAGNVVLMVQPPRGFGENPVAIYHDPDLPPSHHYLAAYHWIDAVFGADAVVHLGKHGNLEWLPGKTLGMSAACGADAALGNLPLIYPFLVNDPGEGTQAKRRAHATLVDHLIPPMARAETYGDIARLEQLLDEHANIAALDPGKLPAIRQQIWTLMRAAKMDHDLGLAERPEDDSFDDMLLHVDGWLCEIKDVQIRDGLHILGEKPTGGSRTRSGAGDPARSAAVRRRADGAGPSAGARPRRGRTRRTRGRRCRRRAGPRTRCRAAEHRAGIRTAWIRSPTTPTWRPSCDSRPPRWCRGWRARRPRSPQILRALDGRFIAAGPSGSPLRGLVNVLPTGRNFYSVDPKAVPSRLAWETGVAMADSLLARYREDYGDWPRSVGLSVWGTSAMRTAGDDIAEVLALLGVRPVWDDASRRVVNLEAIPLAELGRPRIDVTVRISGFFRDAFPHVVTMLDDAVQLVAGLDEPAEDNYVRAHAQADIAEHGDERRSTTRIFGSKPGTYGAGLLQLIDSRNWRDDADLAEVYTAWGGFAYGRGLDGKPAADDMNRQLPADRGGGQEHRHPRARHRRLRRLLPVPRRHGRHRAGADRKGTRRLHRRQHPPRRRAHPHAVGGDHSRVPRPRRQSPMDQRDAAARLQGRLRDGRDRRLSVRIRRHRRRDGRLDVRAPVGGVRARRREPQVHGGVEPVGPARHGRATAGGGRPRHVGAAGTGHARRPARSAAGDRRRARGLSH